MAGMVTVLPTDPLGKSQAILDWCRVHGIDGNTCYKIEADGEWVTFYRYATLTRNPVQFRIDPLTMKLAKAPITILRQRLPLPTEDQVLAQEQRA